MRKTKSIDWLSLIYEVKNDRNRPKIDVFTP
nr:MAG TPA: hypothetical protein [Caudoviricetes sp.]